MLALLAVSLGYLLVILDATAVNVALAPIGADLGGGARTLQWVLDAYTLVFAAFLLTAGSGGDRVGARRLFQAGLVLFAAASAACGSAPTATALVAARALQGLGAALLVPCSLSLVRAAFPGERERARALGAWGAVGGIGAAAGPLFGGAVASAVGWRAVFLVNLPLAALALLLTRRHVPAPPRRREVALDPLGQLLATVAVAALVLALIERLPAAGLVALAAGAAFAAWELRTRAPMLPPALLRRRALAGGSAVGLLINLGFYGQLLVVALLLERGRGWSAWEAGLGLLPEALTVTAASLLAGGAAGRVGARLPMLAGLACGAAGLTGLALLLPGASYAALVPALTATGLGMATTMPAATAAVVGAAPAQRAGTAAGVLNAARQLGSAIGVALLGGLVAGNLQGGTRAALLLAAAAFAAAFAVTWATVAAPPGAPAAPAEGARSARSAG